MGTFAKKVIIDGKSIVDITQTTATTADVLKGKQFITGNGEYAFGNIEAKDVNDILTIDSTEERQTIIPSGYYKTAITKSEDKVRRAETTLTVEANTNAKSLTFTASND
jgi:hypothetical protein